MLDRREAGSQVEAMKTSTTTQIQQVVAARRALGKLRETLWTPDEPELEPAADALPPDVS
jgi:hypothetical protein